MNTAITIPENHSSDHHIQWCELSERDAYQIAHDDFDNGDFHLFQAMHSMRDTLKGADLVYHNEFQWLINTRRFLV